MRFLILLTIATFFSGMALAQETPLPSSIAYIGTDYNVYTLSEGNQFQLTTDGSTARAYQWLTWSNDGRLSYFCCDLRTASTAETVTYISSDGKTAGEEVLRTNGQSVIYAYWSPNTCGDAENCRDLVLLVNNISNGSLSLEVVRDTNTGEQNFTLGTGSPFYYSFSPNGDNLLFHRDNQVLDVFSISENRVVRAFRELSSGSFQSPSWSPTDERLLIGLQGASRGETNLVIIDGETETIIAEGLQGLTSFSWSPNGRYVAYREISNRLYGSLTIIDTLTGEEVAKNTIEGVLAFFWSPDSEKIAYVGLRRTGSSVGVNNVTVGMQTNSVSLGWGVLNIVSGINLALDTFVPTYEMGYMMSYFDQFSQSHRIWSPDSRFIVYSALEGEEEKPIIAILDIDAQGSSKTIAEGVFAVWSFE